MPKTFKCIGGPFDGIDMPEPHAGYFREGDIEAIDGKWIDSGIVNDECIYVVRHGKLVYDPAGTKKRRQVIANDPNQRDVPIGELIDAAMPPPDVKTLIANTRPKFRDALSELWDKHLADHPPQERAHIIRVGLCESLMEHSMEEMGSNAHFQLVMPSVLRQLIDEFLAEKKF